VKYQFVVIILSADNIFYFKIMCHFYNISIVLIIINVIFRKTKQSQRSTVRTIAIVHQIRMYLIAMQTLLKTTPLYVNVCFHVANILLD
jgi:hypothetical protein